MLNASAIDIFRVMGALNAVYLHAQSIDVTSLDEFIEKLERFDGDISLLTTIQSDNGNNIFYWLACPLNWAAFNNDTIRIEQLHKLWVRILDKAITTEAINTLFERLAKSAEDEQYKGTNAFFWLAKALREAVAQNNTINIEQLQRFWLLLLDKAITAKTTNMLFEELAKTVEYGQYKKTNAFYWLTLAIREADFHNNTIGIQQLQRLLLLLLEKAPSSVTINKNVGKLLYWRDKFVELLLAQITEMCHLGNLNGALRRLENASNPETVIGRFFNTHHVVGFGQTDAIKLIDTEKERIISLITEQDDVGFIPESVIYMEPMNSRSPSDSSPSPDSAAELLAVLGAMANRGKGPAPTATVFTTEPSSATPAIASSTSSPST